MSILTQETYKKARRKHKAKAWRNKKYRTYGDKK